MKAVITVIGKDMVGILAKYAAACADTNANVINVSQSVMGELFVMVLMAEVESLNIPFTDFASQLDALGKSLGMVTHTMHEDIFNSMHRI